MADTINYIRKEGQRKYVSDTEFTSLDKSSVPVGTEYNIVGEIEESDLSADLQTKINSTITATGNISISDGKIDTIDVPLFQSVMIGEEDNNSILENSVSGSHIFRLPYITDGDTTLLSLATVHAGAGVQLTEELVGELTISTNIEAGDNISITKASDSKKVIISATGLVKQVGNTDTDLAYVHSAVIGETTFPITQSVVGSSIARRTNIGTIEANDPKDDLDCVNLQYANDTYMPKTPIQLNNTDVVKTITVEELLALKSGFYSASNCILKGNTTDLPQGYYHIIKNNATVHNGDGTFIAQEQDSGKTYAFYSQLSGSVTIGWRQLATTDQIPAITQTTGSNTGTVMSQKAVTDKLDKKQATITTDTLLDVGAIRFKGLTEGSVNFDMVGEKGSFKLPNYASGPHILATQDDVGNARLKYIIYGTSGTTPLSYFAVNSDAYEEPTFNAGDKILSLNAPKLKKINNTSILGTGNITTPDTNTAHTHSAGAGLTVSGSGGISGAVAYNLKVASASEIGGVKPGVTSGKTYGVSVDDSGAMTVSVPWENNTWPTAGNTGYAGINNTGTVTSVAVKMNGATKGTVKTSGTIDLGTVLTGVSAGDNIAVSGSTISVDINKDLNLNTHHLQFEGTGSNDEIAYIGYENGGYTIYGPQKKNATGNCYFPRNGGTLATTADLTNYVTTGSFASLAKRVTDLEALLNQEGYEVVLVKK